MIEWRDLYKVVNAVLPLYAPLTLGYGSVKWWNMFKSEQCDTINRFFCYFVLPIYSFDFIAHIDPYHMNYRFIVADIISKIILVMILALWATFTKKGSFSWFITSLVLSSLSNTVIVGVPFLDSMYGEVGKQLTIQSYTIQTLLWFPALLFMLEIRRARAMPGFGVRDRVEGGGERGVVEEGRVSLFSLLKTVSYKVLRNPNCFACYVSVIWGLVAYRWHFHMPEVIDGCIKIVAKAGACVAMFSMGLFMAVQPKIVACGSGLTIVAMVLRFVVGPAAMVIASLVVRLHGDIFRASFIQAALPQAITAFVFAKEYSLHAEVFSVSISVGTIISVPVLIAYYAILEVIHI
ncbi:hypothetical protein Leryth_023638 [Lithospermum erythrorhizon]|nr:hypothetical protein Leryth_023638 [Lithospermum erythrorhizon]